jgi:D-methionine transport system substrate-binding protein
MTKILKCFFTLAMISILISCSSHEEDNSITVGTMSGPETELVDIAQKTALQKYGLTVKIIEFNDYNLPNAALEDGTLDINIYQHLPFLQASIEANNYNLEVIGKTFVYPAGVYSNKIKNIKELKTDDIVAIPNDPSNEARALILLEQAGLLNLKDRRPSGLQSIRANLKHLRIVELDAAQLPRSLDDVTIAVINTNFALPAGLHPETDAIYLENKNTPYANIIVMKKNNSKKAQIMLFVEEMHSQEVVKKAKDLFGKSAIPAW